MPSPSRTYQAEVYEHFHEIDGSAFRDVVHFYEQNEADIDQLDIDAYFEVRTAYVLAVFEVARYHDYIRLSQSLLEGIIYHDVEIPGEEDIYLLLLLKKAAAHFQLLEYDAAENILWQILRMKPDHTVAAFLLKRSLIKNEPKFIANAKGASILIFLTAAVVIAGELLVVKAFMPEWSTRVEHFRIATFSMGCVLLVSTDLYHRFCSFRQVQKEVDRLKTLARDKRQ